MFKPLKLIVIVLLIINIIVVTSVFTCFVKIIKENITQEKLISIYNSVVQFFGNFSLSKDKDLNGVRKFGIDKYVGTYSAIYNDYTGDEVIFGGTNISRKNSDKINLKIELKKEGGNVKVINRIGDKDIVILDDTGEYNDIIYIDGLSYYLKLEFDNFSGNIEVLSK